MKRSAPVLIGDILKEFFSRPYIAAKVAEGKLPVYWRTLVGDRIADMTIELRLDKHILYVRVSSGIVRQELFYQRDMLTQRLNELAGVTLVVAIIIK